MRMSKSMEKRDLVDSVHEQRTSPRGVRLFAAMLISTVSTAVLGQTVQQSVSVTVPNGYMNVVQDDMIVQSTGGPVRVTRVWDGYEWKFNPLWESLSQSWKNLTGSQTADTTAGTVSGDTPAATATLASSSNSQVDNSGCWVWVDEDWEPSAGRVIIGGVPFAGPAGPERITPFNRIMGEDENNYSQPMRVSVDYASLCAGTMLATGVQDLEGIRRKNELYLGDAGRYAFSNRAVLEKRSVQQIPDVNAGGIQQLGTGSFALAPATNPKGYRWIHKEGDWIDFNTQGQVVAYGDRNNNTVWLVRDQSGTLRGVVDAVGQVLFTLHYSGPLLTEVRDYPRAGNDLDLPARSVRYQYDEKNLLSVVTDVRGNTIRYGYDNLNRITSITDQEGRVERIEYAGDSVAKRIAADGTATDYVFEYDDANKQFTSKITGPEVDGGRRVDDYTHNRSGKLVRHIVNGRIEKEVRYDTGTRSERHTNARGFVTKFTRNEFEQLSQVDQADRTTAKRSYSPLHLEPLEDTDEAGVRTQYQHDSKGNLLRVLQAVGTAEERVVDYEVNALGQITTLTYRGRTESNGTVTADAIWNIEYDASGQIDRITDPEGGVQIFVFDRIGNLARYTDANSHATRYETDPAGNLTKVTDALGRTQDLGYDKVGNPTSVKDERAKITRLGYDAMNRLGQVTSAVAGIYRVEYDNRGMPVRETDEDGRVTRREFDAFLRLTRQLDGRGDAINLGYQVSDGTSAGMLGSIFNPTRVQFPTYTEERRYDALERLTSSSIQNPSPQGLVSLGSGVTYDSRGNVETETDAYGKVRLYNYDAYNRLTRVTDALRNVTSVEYDARGNLLQLTDANNNTTRFEYDRADRLVTQIQPLGQTTRYEYDDAGNLTKTIDGKGNQVVNVYDETDRLVRREVTAAGAAAAEVTTYAYDAAGNLTNWAVGDMSAVLTYDDANRKLSETVSYGDNISLGYSYTYTAAGYKRTMTYPDGTTLTYAYESNGELSAVDIPGEGTMSVNSWNWVAPTQITLPGGTKQQYQQDGVLSLTLLSVKSPGQTELLSLANSYGSLGELKQRSIDAATSAFTYDDEQRLLQVTGAGAQTFTLDAVSNRLTQSATTGTWQNDANNRLRSQAGIAYDYDDAGNLIRKTAGGVVTQYLYDGLNRLVEIQNGTGQIIASYAYDPMSRRLWKQVGGVRTYFLYSDEGLIAEANSLGVVTTEYGWKPDGIWGTDPLFIKTPIGSGSSVDVRYAYFHTDHLGTPLRATDKSGSVVWSAAYDAFGGVTLPASNQMLSNLRFGGQYFDSESGFYYNWHRYYDPAVGRYIQVDPVGLLAGSNLYAYLNGDPLNLIDPYGLWSWGDPLPDGLVNGAAGFGDTVSMGLTSVIRDLSGTNGVVDKCSDAYGYGQAAGVGVSLSFGAAHLGKNAWAQGSVKHLFSDRRTWNAVQKKYSRSVGGYKGKYELHHWFDPRSGGGSGIPGSNAGWNYLPISRGLNNAMGDGTRSISQRLLFNGFKGTTIGIYGGLPTSALQELTEECGCEK